MTLFIRRRNSTPDRDLERYSASVWNGTQMREIFSLPPATSPPICRIPIYDEDEDVQTRIDRINLDYVSKFF